LGWAAEFLENFPACGALLVLPKGPLNSDSLLKLLIRGASTEPFRQMHVGPVQQWLNVDLPRIQNRLVDLVGRAADGRLLHIELQSTNDPLMAQRMAEYALAILRALKEYPVQVVVYVGNEKLRMIPELRTLGMAFHYHQVDLRDLDGEPLLESDRFEDNLLSLLSGLGDLARGIRLIVARIKRMKESQRMDALEQLLLTCELRGIESTLTEELKHMPVTHVPDMSKYDFVRKARQEGRQEGRREGMREFAHTLLEKRFGRLPDSIVKRLAELSDIESQKLASDLLDARSLQELFGDSSQ